MRILNPRVKKGRITEIHDIETTETGLETHFKKGCSQYSGPSLRHVKIALLEQFDTTEEKLRIANNKPGAGCRRGVANAKGSTRSKING